MSQLVFSDKTRRLLRWSLALLLVARVICIFLVPLTDTTEARYAEIARKMLETGNWVTLLHDYGVPFWAKPPLSTWLSAFSMKLFGVNEFGARLPSLLLAIGILALVWLWTAQRRGRDFALFACVILSSSVLFFAAAGAVMTDSSLALTTTLAMVAFWQALYLPAGSGTQRIWSWLFFVALGLGLLAKGPLVGVLTFLPIVPWVLLRRNIRAVWSALPWIGGTLLMLAISLPWYLLAEHRTPGFLEYFIIGEHFKRFLDSGWQGDRYGHAHAEPLGMIWGFWFISAFPWSAVIIGFLVRHFRRARALAHDDDGWFSYLLLWSCMTMVFFSAAHNIIWPYPFPALPAFAVLLVELFRRTQAQPRVGERTGRVIIGMVALVPACFLALALAYGFNLHHIVKSSEKALVQAYKEKRSSDASRLFYYHSREYSAEFYTAGKVKVINRFEDLPQDSTETFIAVRSRDLRYIPPALQARLEPLGRFTDYELLREKPVQSH